MCRIEKSLGDFRKDTTRQDGRNVYCKLCRRLYDKSNYTLKYGGKGRIRNNARFISTKAKIMDYKACHPCLNCGEADPVCLEFHHLDPSQKNFTISSRTNGSWELNLKEIQKCVVLCANCHRKLHHGSVVLQDGVSLD